MGPRWGWSCRDSCRPILHSNDNNESKAPSRHRTKRCKVYRCPEITRKIVSIKPKNNLKEAKPIFLHLCYTSWVAWLCQATQLDPQKNNHFILVGLNELTPF